MKHIFFLTCLLLSSVGLAQSVNKEANGVQFFSQVLLSDAVSASDLGNIQQDLNQNPHIEMARVDQINKTIYIVTKDIDSYNRASFENWIGTNIKYVECYRQGIRGVDSFIPFDENFCNQSE